jgi:hypothetical protein
VNEQPRLSRRAVLGGAAAVAGAAVTAPLVGSAPAVAAATKVGFHPGHYIWLDRRYWDAEKMKNDLAFLNKYGDNPYIKGIKIGLGWVAFEAARGDFSSGHNIIGQYLKALEGLPTKKYLMVEVDSRTYGQYSDNMYPAYLADEIPDGGVLYRPDGANWGNTYSIARIWEPAIMDRLIDMSRALGHEFDTHPNFEMLSLGETAVDARIPTFSDSKWIDALKMWFLKGKQAWPSTQLRLNANWLGADDRALADMFNYIVNEAGPVGGVSIGGPDPEFPDRSIAANRVFRGEGMAKNEHDVLVPVGTDLRKKVPWVGEVQAFGLGNRKSVRPKEIWQYEFGQMHAHYMVWLYNNKVVKDAPPMCQWEAEDENHKIVGEWPDIQEIKAEIHLAPPTIGLWETA